MRSILNSLNNTRTSSIQDIEVSVRLDTSWIALAIYLCPFDWDISYNYIWNGTVWCGRQLHIGPIVIWVTPSV